MHSPLVSVVIPTHNRKEKLMRLINSLLNGYENKEIIVVDDHSSDGTPEDVKKLFPTVKVISNSKELFLAGSRNVGIVRSRGDFVFLIDDDNLVDSDTVTELLKAMKENEKIGVAGPLMYYYEDPKRIWCAGIKRSYITSRTMFLGQGSLNEGRYRDYIDSEEFPNAFMVRREVFEKVGLFDEKSYPFHYGEADFCQRAKKAGFKVVLVPKAKVWHDVPLRYGIKSIKGTRLDEHRAYYYGRNRIIFHMKYSKRAKLVLFMMIFEPILIIPSYLALFLLSNEKATKKLKLALAYLRGVLHGLIKANSLNLR